MKRPLRFLAPALSILLASPLFAQQLHWAHAFQTNQAEQVNGTAVDDAGYMYSTGDMHATFDADPSPTNTLNITLAGTSDAFVLKFDSVGHVIWGFDYSANNASGKDVTVDLNGDIITCGSFSGTAFFDPPANNDSATSVTSSTDAFVAKYDSSGAMIWARTFGGNNNDYVGSVVTDDSGNVYIAGQFQNTVDFDPGAGVFTMTPGSGIEAGYFAKYSPSGQFLWAKCLKTLTGATTSTLMRIRLDQSGNIIIAGFDNGTIDFDPSASTQSLVSSGSDIYVAKYDHNGNYMWAYNLGSSGNDYSYGLDVDHSNNIYIDGKFNSTVDFDPGAGTQNLTSNGSGDAFLAKYDPAGQYLWAFSFGGSSFDDFGETVEVNSLDQVYIGGTFTGTVDLDPGSNTATHTSNTGGANQIAYVAKYDSSGNFIWGLDYQGTNVQTNSVMSLATYSDPNTVYGGGYLYGVNVDFDPGPGTTTFSGQGQYDAVIFKYNDLWGGVGMNELNAGMIRSWPSPFTNELHVAFPENDRTSRIEMYDVHGQIVSTMIRNNESEIHIGRNNIASGIYFLRMYAADGSILHQQKVIAD